MCPSLNSTSRCPVLLGQQGLSPEIWIAFMNFLLQIRASPEMRIFTVMVFTHPNFPWYTERESISTRTCIEIFIPSFWSSNSIPQCKGVISSEPPRKHPIARAPVNDEEKSSCLMLTGWEMGGKNSFWSSCLRSKGYRCPSKAGTSVPPHLLSLSWMLMHTELLLVCTESLSPNTLGLYPHLPA